MAETSKSKGESGKATEGSSETGKSGRKKSSRVASLVASAALLASTAAPLTAQASPTNSPTASERHGPVAVERQGHNVTSNPASKEKTGAGDNIRREPTAPTAGQKTGSRVGGFTRTQQGPVRLTDAQRRIFAPPKLDRRGGFIVERPAHPFSIRRGWDRDAFFPEFFATINFDNAIQAAIANDINDIVLNAQAAGDIVYAVPQPNNTLAIIVEQPNGVAIQEVIYAPQGPENVLISRARIDNGIVLTSGFSLALQFGTPTFQVLTDINL